MNSPPELTHRMKNQNRTKVLTRLKTALHQGHALMADLVYCWVVLHYLLTLAGVTK